jgi:mono/diheme cytochrome c family protein
VKLDYLPLAGAEIVIREPRTQGSWRFVRPDGSASAPMSVRTHLGATTTNPAPSSGVGLVAATEPGLATPPEGTHPDAGRSTPALPTPPGATADQVALGDQIFHGEASDGTCSGCHGSDAGGSTVGPALNSAHWLWSDGSLSGLTATIENGVAHPTSNIRASCRRWAGPRFRRGTWRRWRHTFGPSAMRESIDHYDYRDVMLATRDPLKARR